jgi:hypothetical protein
LKEDGDSKFSENLRDFFEKKVQESKRELPQSKGEKNERKKFFGFINVTP